MVITDALEGVIDSRLVFHYDFNNDVLHLRRVEREGSETFGEETDDGLILHRDSETDELVALTVISWWDRFGSGGRPDSVAELSGRIEVWAGSCPLSESPR